MTTTPADAGKERLAVVFVHGLASGVAAWDRLDGLLNEDAALSGIPTHRFRYDSPRFGRRLTRREPSHEVAADLLATFMRLNIREPEVVLVAHSQGGLIALHFVVRYLLKSHRDPDLPRLRLALLYACPNLGSAFALGVRRYMLPRHSQERSLRPLSERTAHVVREVVQAVSTSAVSSMDLQVVAVAGASDAIVTPASAKGTWRNVETVEGDHGSVIRPQSADDDRYKVMARRLHELLRTPVTDLSAAEARGADDYWLRLAQEVAQRLHFDEWDAAFGGLVSTRCAVLESVMSDLQEFTAWVHGRIYPAGHADLRRSLQAMGLIAGDLLQTFGQRAVRVEEFADQPWLQVDRWYKRAGINALYEDEVQEYAKLVNLVADLTFELTRAAEWFCDVVRLELDPMFRIDHGALLLEGGPYDPDGETRVHRVAYTPTERAAEPLPYVNLETFRDESRYQRDVHTRDGKTDDSPVAIAAGGLDAVERMLFDEQKAQLDAEKDVYRKWLTIGDRDSTVAALRQGINTRLLSNRGVRSPIWETALHLRFALDEQTRLWVSIEDDGGLNGTRVEWPPRLAAIDVFRQLNEAMADLGRHLGPGLFSPADSIRSLVSDLLFACGYRSQRLNLGSENFEGIIEIVDGWFITARGLFPKEHSHYLIARERFDELDWEQHISDKGWIGLHAALRVARALLPPETDRSEARGARSD